MGEGRRVRISLLGGGVRAEAVDGRTVDVGPAKRQAVLAALALAPGRAVPVNLLVEAVWGEDPPRTAEKTLQAHVVHLRRALGPDAIARVGAAYRLDVDPHDVDVARFRARLADGDVSAALAEWTGPPLVGLDAPGLSPAVHGLVERWLGAVEQDLAARIDVDPASTIALLHDLTATHPLRERLWELLMAAQHRVGRQADALATYRSARRRLVDELGVEPGPGLRDLQAQVLAAEDGPPGTDHRAPPPGLLQPPPDLLQPPRPRGTLHGRREDLNRLTDALGRSPVVTLLGPGGVGKTRLALEAVATDDVADAWFVELTASDDVPRAVAATLGIRQAAGQSLTESVVHALHRRAGLLVLDNCEHVIEGAADLARAVADRCPEVVVLATSREGLGLVEERLVPLAPLDPVGAGAELFAERASAVSPTFDPITDRQDVEEICRRLDGLPLAIELAAARTATLTCADVVGRLGDRLRLLDGRRRGAAPRHQTLRATLQWSIDLLPPQAREDFAALAVFTGPFDVAAAHVVVGGDRDVVAIDDVLAGLAERSLLVVEASPAGRRHRMLETMRELGAEMLAGTGRLETVQGRHTAWCLEEANRAGRLLRGNGEMEGAALVARLWPDLRSAFDRACAAGDVGLADRLLRPVASELGMRTRLEVGEWAEEVLARLPVGDDRTLHWMLWATQRHLELGDGPAIDSLVASYGHADHPLVLHATTNLAGDGHALVASSEAAVGWLRETGEAHLAEWMEVVGVAAGLLRAGRLAEHDAHVEALLARPVADRPPTIRHWAHFMLGYSALFAGDPERAQRCFDTSAAIVVPPCTFSANRPAQARAAFRRGEVREAIRILDDHVVELLDADANLVATRLVGVEVITVTAALDRLPDAARMLGHLQTTGGFGELAAGTVVADVTRAVAASRDPAVALALEEGRGMDHLAVLTWSHDLLRAMAGPTAQRVRRSG